jgi:hypothetical protein
MLLIDYIQSKKNTIKKMKRKDLKDKVMNYLGVHSILKFYNKVQNYKVLVQLKEVD